MNRARQARRRAALPFQMMQRIVARRWRGLGHAAAKSSVRQPCDEEAVEAGMARRVSVQSFDWRTLRLVRQLDPDIPTVYLTVQTANSDNLRDGDWTGGLKFADHGSAPKMVKASMPPIIRKSPCAKFSVSVVENVT